MEKMSNNQKPDSGRKHNQRMKAYLVLQYLLQKSDDDHILPITEIADYLQEECGIDAERRSIYKDIHEINVVNLMLLDSCTFAEAEKALAEDDGLALIRYKKRKENSGYYVCNQNRSLSFEEARLLAECIYSARFIPRKRKKNYVDLISAPLSEEQAAKLEHDVVLMDSQSTMNAKTLDNIDKIKEAIDLGNKICFQYVKYEIKDSVPILTARRGGELYTASPYAMLIDNGNYYLLAIDERFKKKDLRTFRIDRIRSLKLLREPRSETEETKALDLQDYTRHVFSMYGGTQERVTLRFVTSLLDTAVDRFGTDGVIYSQIDKEHVTVTTTVEISKSFYGWLCSFGKMAKILAPDWVVADFSKYIKSLSDWYQS